MMRRNRIIDLTIIKLSGAQIMADSENSRTLPLDARRNLLSNAQNLLVKKVAKQSLALKPDHTQSALAVWQDWNIAWQQVVELCRRQQRLEGQLLDVVGGFPSVMLFADTDQPVQAQFNSDVERWLPGPTNAGARRAAIEELNEKHRKWAEADAEIGFEAALADEANAEARADELARRLWSTPAVTLADVLAKLHALLEMDDPAPWRDERPWTQLRTILSEMISVTSTILARDGHQQFMSAPQP